jgi:hypothetical protein
MSRELQPPLRNERVAEYPYGRISFPPKIDHSVRYGLPQSLDICAYSSAFSQCRHVLEHTWPYIEAVVSRQSIMMRRRLDCFEKDARIIR